MPLFLPPSWNSLSPFDPLVPPKSILQEYRNPRRMKNLRWHHFSRLTWTLIIFVRSKSSLHKFWFVLPFYSSVSLQSSSKTKSGMEEVIKFLSDSRSFSSIPVSLTHCKFGKLSSLDSHLDCKHSESNVQSFRLSYIFFSSLFSLSLSLCSFSLSLFQVSYAGVPNAPVERVSFAYYNNFAMVWVTALAWR